MPPSNRLAFNQFLFFHATVILAFHFQANWDGWTRDSPAPKVLFDETNLVTSLMKFTNPFSSLPDEDMTKGWKSALSESNWLRYDCIFSWCFFSTACVWRLLFVLPRISALVQSTEVKSVSRSFPSRKFNSSTSLLLFCCMCMLDSFSVKVLLAWHILTISFTVVLCASVLFPWHTKRWYPVESNSGLAAHLLHLRLCVSSICAPGISISNVSRIAHKNEDLSQVSCEHVGTTNAYITASETLESANLAKVCLRFATSVPSVVNWIRAISANKPWSFVSEVLMTGVASGSL